MASAILRVLRIGVVPVVVVRGLVPVRAVDALAVVPVVARVSRFPPATTVGRLVVRVTEAAAAPLVEPAVPVIGVAMFLDERMITAAGDLVPPVLRDAGTGLVIDDPVPTFDAADVVAVEPPVRPADPIGLAICVLRLS